MAGVSIVIITMHTMLPPASASPTTAAGSSTMETAVPVSTTGSPVTTWRYYHGVQKVQGIKKSARDKNILV